MITILIDDHIPFIKNVLEPYSKIIYVKEGKIGRSLAMKADGIIIRTRTRCDAELLEGTPVRFIATATIGFDHIDTEYCSRKGISWHYAPGCNASSVGQYMASLLGTLSLRHGVNLHGKKLGIVGAGHTGSAAEHLAGALGMIPVLNDPPRERRESSGRFASLEEVRETCDIITLHVPLTHEGHDKTYRLADDSFFRSLAKKPFLINTSRGPVVREDSVKQALRDGYLSGYAADVWENEPVIDREILGMSLIGTPHIAGYSVEGKVNGTASCVRAASRFFGFGIDQWIPPALPPPPRSEILINTKGNTDEMIQAGAILASYDVKDDDGPFRREPSQFESLRNNYRTRREFGAFTLTISGAVSPLISSSLQSLGFRIKPGE